jgi:hypothetical protein
MDLAQFSFVLFALFSGVRLFSYLPQIHKVASDTNKASAISYSTWSMWTGANLATALYAATNLKDLYLAAVSMLYAACCLTVIGLTAFKRLVDLPHARQQVEARVGLIEDRRAGLMSQLQACCHVWSTSSCRVDLHTGDLQARMRRCSRGIVCLDIHHAMLSRVVRSLQSVERRLLLRRHGSGESM